uniref:PEP-CTERM motif protein n=1 Tax=uncultured bacterium CSL11 TaxID=1091566 RepID=G4WVD9_9BACT|nr:PEP-CTERM motif protein [uncultured bacterium CSL11]
MSPAPGAQGGWDTITTITQHNNIIPGPLSWNDQTILGRLKIFDGATKVADELATQVVSFVETDNNGFVGGGQVPDPTQCSGPNPLKSQCDDFFTLTGAGFLPFMFMAVDGSAWLVEFRLANLVNAIQIGNVLFTAEDSTDSIDVQMRITPKGTTNVAEPGTLTLLGIGLLGLGFAFRLRKDRGTA